MVDPPAAVQAVSAPVVLAPVVLAPAELARLQIGKLIQIRKLLQDQVRFRLHYICKHFR